MKLIRLTKDTRIKSFDCGTETHNETEEYPFMTSCNNDELVNHVLAREEEYAKTGNAVDFLEMMVDFKNEFEW